MNSRIKITFVINNLSGGGAERILVNILNNLDRHKFEPRLFLFEYEGDYLKSLSKDIEIGFSKKCTTSKKSRISIFNSIKKQFNRYTSGSKELEEFIKEDDCVVAYLEKMSTYALGKIIRKSNKCSYAWLHTNASDFSTIHKFLSKKYYKYYKNVFCVSSECAEIAKKEFSKLSDKIEYIYNPIEIEKIIEKSNENSFYDLPSGKNIVAIGRLTTQKAFDTLIKAFALIKVSNVNLIILGEGEEREYLEALIKENNLEEKVQLPGFVNNPFAILKKSDLFVLSSRIEGLPTVLIEALALNKKIVSTKCSGSREILNNGEYGYLVEVDDVEELAEKITSAILSSNNVNGLMRAMEFDKSNIIKQLENRLSKDLGKEIVNNES